MLIKLHTVVHEYLKILLSLINALRKSGVHFSSMLYTLHNPDKPAKVHATVKTLITFRVSGRKREMYIGLARPCVCLYSCLSDCPSPHFHTTARTQM